MGMAKHVGWRLVVHVYLFMSKHKSEIMIPNDEHIRILCVFTSQFRVTIMQPNNQLAYRISMCLNLYVNYGMSYVYPYENDLCTL